MSKLLIIVLSMTTIIGYCSLSYDGSTTAPVILAGAIIKTTGSDIGKKYPRKDCPVCKGTGKYLSGDTISWVDCGYCDPAIKTDSEVTHPPIILKSEKISCQNKNCKCKNCSCHKCGCLPSVE